VKFLPWLRPYLSGGCTWPESRSRHRRVGFLFIGFGFTKPSAAPWRRSQSLKMWRNFTLWRSCLTEKVLLKFVIVYLAWKVYVSDADDRITNGQTAGRGQFPWQVAIIREDVGFCGGSLISDTWILTAAYCA